MEDDLNFKAVLLSLFNNKNLKNKWFYTIEIDLVLIPFRKGIDFVETVLNLKGKSLSRGNGEPKFFLSVEKCSAEVANFFKVSYLFDGFHNFNLFNL